MRRNLGRRCQTDCQRRRRSQEKYLNELGEEDLTPEDTDETPQDEGEIVEEVEVEEKQDAVEITSGDIARAIAKWDERMPEAAGILQGS